jgi:hypothetical protein
MDKRTTNTEKIGIIKYWFGFIFKRAISDILEYMKEHVAMALLLICVALLASWLSANGLLNKAISEGYISDASSLIRLVFALLVLSLLYLLWSMFYYPVLLHSKQENDKKQLQKVFETKQEQIDKLENWKNNFEGLANAEKITLQKIDMGSAIGIEIHNGETRNSFEGQLWITGVTKTRRFGPIKAKVENSSETLFHIPPSESDLPPLRPVLELNAIDKLLKMT